MSQGSSIIMFDVNSTSLSDNGLFILESVLGYSLSILLVAMYIPQIIKIAKYKSSDDLSYKFIFLSIIAECIDIVYGIIINQLPIVVTGVLLLISCILLVILKCIYDTPKNKKIQKKLSITWNEHIGDQVKTHRKEVELPIDKDSYVIDLSASCEAEVSASCEAEVSSHNRAEEKK